MKLSELPVGSKIKFGKYQVETEEPEVICWLVADQNHEGYPDNSTTLITEKIIDLRAFDAMEPNNEDTDRQKYGNNRWTWANVNTWLNSDQKEWYIAKHTTDEAPTDSYTNNYSTGYNTKPGFLNLFTEAEKQLILDTELITARNTVTDGGGSDVSTSKVFLFSATEVGLTNENNIAEGSKLALFSDDTSRIAYVTQQCFDNTKSTSRPTNIGDYWYWWLRTPFSYHSGNVRGVNSSGTLRSSNAFNGDYGLRPALNISNTVILSDTPDSDGYYTIIYPSFDISNFKKIAIVGDGELENMQTAIETNTSNISALADKIGSTQASANANSYDILTVIMALKDDWAGDIIGPGMYMDCLTDESTFTVTDGIYDSNNSYIYVN